MFWNRKPKLPSMFRVGSTQYDVVETSKPFEHGKGRKVFRSSSNKALIEINPDIAFREKISVLMEVAFGHSLHEGKNLVDCARILSGALVDNPRFIDSLIAASKVAAKKARAQ